LIETKGTNNKASDGTNGVTPALIIGKNVVPNGYQQGKQGVVVKLNNAIDKEQEEVLSQKLYSWFFKRITTWEWADKEIKYQEGSKATSYVESEHALK